MMSVFACFLYFITNWRFRMERRNSEMFIVERILLVVFMENFLQIIATTNWYVQYENLLDPTESFDGFQTKRFITFIRVNGSK